MQYAETNLEKKETRSRIMAMGSGKVEVAYRSLVS